MKLKTLMYLIYRQYFPEYLYKGSSQKLYKRNGDFVYKEDGSTKNSQKQVYTFSKDNAGNFSLNEYSGNLNYSKKNRQTIITTINKGHETTDEIEPYECLDYHVDFSNNDLLCEVPYILEGSYTTLVNGAGELIITIN